ASRSRPHAPSEAGFVPPTGRAGSEASAAPAVGCACIGRPGLPLRSTWPSRRRARPGERPFERGGAPCLDANDFSARVAAVALSLAAAPMHLLALIKPQFEAARKHSKRGIVRVALVHQEVCQDISRFAASLGCSDIQVFPSSIAGGDGNIEFFIGARRG